MSVCRIMVGRTGRTRKGLKQIAKPIVLLIHNRHQHNRTAAIKMAPLSLLLFLRLLLDGFLMENGNRWWRVQNRTRWARVVILDQTWLGPEGEIDSSARFSFSHWKISHLSVPGKLHRKVTLKFSSVHLTWFGILVLFRVWKCAMLGWCGSEVV